MPTKRGQDPKIETVFFPEDNVPMQGVNKYGSMSRWTIGDNEFADLINWYPHGLELQQVLAPGPVIATLPAPTVWLSAQPLGLATYMFALCTDGHIYQVSLGGAVINVTGSTTVSTKSDIANWQGTVMLFSDPVSAKIYSWTGTVFATVFSGQPAEFITVFNSRLWMAHNNTVTFTAVNTYSSLGGDSGSFIITDTDCPAPIRVVAPYSGSLYIGGYAWFQTVGGLFDSGTPAVLQFQKTTLTDHAGIFSKWSFCPFGYSLFYASLYGIWNLYGAQPIYISGPIDEFFAKSDPALSSYSAAYGVIYNNPVVMWNLFYTPDSSYRLLCYSYNATGAGLWFTCSFGQIKFVTGGVDQITGQKAVWAADAGGSLFELFADTGNVNVTSTLHTKLWSFGTRIREKSIIRAGHEIITTASATISLTARDENLNRYTPTLQSVNPTNTFLWTNEAETFNWTNQNNPFFWTTTIVMYSLMDFELPITVKKLGLDTVVTSSKLALISTAIEFLEIPADWGQ